MILGRPWALALLAIPVLLLILRLRRNRPRIAEASSLLVWEKVSPSDTPPARPRPPLAAWLEAAGAILLVLGVADPFAADPGVPEPALAGGRAKGGVNAGITSASGAALGDGKWQLLLTIEVHGTPGPVEGRLRIGDREETITVAPGTPLEVVRETTKFVQETSVSFPGDVLADDDRAFLWRKGGEAVCVVAGRDMVSVPLVRALVAAGASLAESDDHSAGQISLKLALPPGASSKVRSTREGLSLSQQVILTGGQQVTGSGVVAADHPLLRDVRIDPESVLGSTSSVFTSPDPGESILRDRFGRSLITVRRLISLDAPEVEGPLGVTLHFQPSGSWVERDPSFVVFAKNLVDYVADGQPRIEATGVLEPRTTREASEAPGRTRRPDPGLGEPLAAIVLLAGAGLLSGAWIAKS